MLILTPRFFISTAIGVAAPEYPSDATATEKRRSVNATRTDASLRFVHFVGFWSHFDPATQSSSWPLPLSQRIEELAEFAENRYAIVAKPLAGDVVLLGSTRGDRHVLAGIILTVETVRTSLDGSPSHICTIIEGELGEPTLRDPDPKIANVRVVRRRLAPAFGDCFIRWCDIGAQASDGVAEYELSHGVVAVDERRRGRPTRAA